MVMQWGKYLMNLTNKWKLSSQAITMFAWLSIAKKLETEFLFESFASLSKEDPRETPYEEITHQSD